MKRTPLRARAPQSHHDEPGYRTWHVPQFGCCANCGTRGLLLRHHVVLERHVRLAGGWPYDLANALQLGYYACACHRQHHSAVRRLPLAKVPDGAIAFAIDLLGEHQAVEYLRRYYSV